jgi:hypothetical protein
MIVSTKERAVLSEHLSKLNRTNSEQKYRLLRIGKVTARATQEQITHAPAELEERNPIATGEWRGEETGECQVYRPGVGAVSFFSLRLLVYELLGKVAG